jgi:hypothetical protein
MKHVSNPMWGRASALPPSFRSALHFTAAVAPAILSPVVFATRRTHFSKYLLP